MTPHPRSAEEWAKLCHAARHVLGNLYPSLCLICARAYAREVGEAVRGEWLDKFSTALFWLLRAYDSGHRQGWEAGPSVQETMDGLFDFLCNEGLDPNKPETPQFKPQIAAALRQIEVKTP